MKTYLTNKQKGQAMQCFSGLLIAVELDPDPKAQNKLTAGYNCFECNSHPYCRILANTLEGGKYSK